MINDKPITTLQDGTLKATIWRNVSHDGTVFYQVQFTRGYTDEQQAWHDSDHFTNTQLLRLSHLATKAYEAAAKLKAMDRQSHSQGQ